MQTLSAGSMMGRKPRIPPTTDHLVQLLMQCEGADASTTFIDGSQNNATITFTNQAQIDTAQARFGSSSIYFDGTGDQVIVPYLDAFETGTGDFTIEYSVRHQTTVTGSKTHMIRWDKQSPVNDVWFIWNSNGNLQLFYSGNGTSFITLTASGYFTGEANAWVDVALSRQGANLYVLKNGVHHTTWDVSTNNFHTGGSWPIRIGSAYDTQSFGHLGWIDNVRFTVGLGRYSTASYTVKEFYRVADDVNVIVPTGLVVHVDAGNVTSYAGTGSTWVDISGNGIDFTIEDSGGVEAAPDYTSGTSGYFTVNNNTTDLYFHATDAALAPDTGDFTISMWTLKSSLVDNSYCWDWGTGNAGSCSAGTSVNPSWRYFNTTLGVGSDLYDAALPGPTANVWYNLTVVRTSGSTSLYVNNTLLATDAGDTFNMSQTKLWIGRYGGPSFAFGHTGRVAAFYMYHRALTADELAQNQSVFDSRYSINTSIEIVAAGLEYYVDAGKESSYTADNWWHGMSGNGERLVIADSSGNKYDPAYTPGPSGYFTNTAPTDLYFQDTTFSAFGTSDYTMGCWIRKSEVALNAYVWDLGINDYSLSAGTSINNGWRHSNDTIGTDSAVSDSQPGPIVNKWYNMVVVRSSGTTSVYANNVLLESVTEDTDNNTETVLHLMRTNTGYPTMFTTAGDIAAFYLYHRALTTGDLATNQAAFEARYIDEYFDNVVLLLPLNGTDAATTTTDLSTTAHTITFNATAQLDTAQSKFGSASLLLDGNSDYLSIADHADWAFGSGEWTIECHVRFNGDPGTAWMNFVNQWTNAGSQKSWWVGYRNNALQAFTSSTGSNGLFILNRAWNPEGDTWYHIAFCRDNSGTDAIRVFVDGVQIGADDTSINANPTHFNPTSDVWIGAYNGDANDWLNGWIDNVRITKGVCRYTSTFTPPTAPYPTS